MDEKLSVLQTAGATITSSNGRRCDGTFPFDARAVGLNLSVLDRNRAAITPRWSSASCFTALLSVCAIDFTSSRDET